MKIGNKCSCILLKTNITNGYITIYKNQLDLFVFSVIFTTKLGVCTLIQTSTLFIYTHVFNQNVKVYKSQLIWTSFWFDRTDGWFRQVSSINVQNWSIKLFTSITNIACIWYSWMEKYSTILFPIKTTSQYTTICQMNRRSDIITIRVRVRFIEKTRITQIDWTWIFTNRNLQERFL